MHTLETHIFNLLSAALPQAQVDTLWPLLETPPNRGEQGDRAVPCFSLAKTLRQAPQQIATNLATTLETYRKAHSKDASLISQVVANGPYINFKANVSELCHSVLERLHKEGPHFGQDPELKGKTAIVEYSSPNIAKPFSIGHLRTTNIGASLARILEARGWKVIRINHLGDWGTQFGKMLCAYTLWGKGQTFDDPLKFFLDLYVRFHKEEALHPELSDDARAWFSRLEKGDEEAKKLWQWFKDVTLAELEKLYKRLGVTFDHYWGESHYIPYLPEVLSLLDTHHLLTRSDDAQIVDLKDHNLSVAVIQKRDESSLYITRDLAAAIYRHRKTPFDLMLYVVGVPQTLHFQQLFKILELTQQPFVSKCEHIAFGHIGFGDEGMSTRKGNIVFLKDVLDEAARRALTLIEEKNPSLDHKEATAEQVGLGAVLFADLSGRRIKDVHFSWDEILRFEGDTGPYLQYSLVRIRSLFARAARTLPPIETLAITSLALDAEADLVRTLSDFPLALARAEREREPFVLASYLLDLAKVFNRYYASGIKLVSSDSDDTPALGATRLHLVSGVAQVLETGLGLLGIPCPEKM